MKIFVTGGTGFIGSYFLNQAHAAGCEIIALRRTPESQPRIPLIKEPVWLDGKMEEVTSEDLYGCDILLHLAAYGATPQPATWQGCFRVNVLDTLRLLESARAAGIRGIVAAGSYAEYGSAGLRYDFIPPDAPLEPIGSYAASKAAASIAIRSFAEKASMSLVYGRVFSAYGAGQFEKNLWPSLKRAALAGENFEMTLGEQIRDFVPVTDVATWFLNALDLCSKQGDTASFWNVASGKPVSLADFCKYWWREFGSSGELKVGAIPYRESEIMRYVPEVK